MTAPLFLPPTPDQPAWRVAVPLPPDAVAQHAKLQELRFNGVRADFSYLVVGGKPLYVSLLPPPNGETGNVLAVAEFLWHDAVDYDIEVRGVRHGEPGTVPADVPLGRSRARAPAAGGAPPGWTHGEVLRLEEPAGLDRRAEPVEIVVRAHKEDVTDLARELRVFEVAPGAASCREVPSQVFNVRTYAGQPATWTYPFLARPAAPFLDWSSISASVVFSADVPAGGRKIYLAAWGNRDAPAPAYASDLRVGPPGVGRTIENARLAVDFFKNSGQINSFRMKGTRGDVVLGNKLGAAHWNPDACSEQHGWIHATNWDPPPKTHVFADGPLLYRETRSGPLPGCEAVWCSVTYSFYAGLPWVRVNTALEVRKEAALAVVRNGEMVFDAPLFDRAAWKLPEGRIETIRVPLPFKPGHTHNLEIPADIPWCALYYSEKGYGFAGIHLASHAYHRDEGTPATYRPSFFLYSQPLEWGQPIVYFTRGPLYAFAHGDHGPSLSVGPGSVYVEEGVYAPFETAGADATRTVEELDRRVRIPLRAGYGPKPQAGD